MHPQKQTPWVCLDDFIEVLSPKDKWGGGPTNLHNIEVFKDTLNYCGLNDLDCEGYRYVVKQMGGTKHYGRVARLGISKWILEGVLGDK